LADEVDSVECLRVRLRKFVIEALRERLESVGVHTPIDVKVLAELLDGPTPRPEMVEQLEQLLSAPTKTVVARAQPAFAADVN
jgi:hypothetical protein